MGRWSIWRGWTHIGGTRKQVGSWSPNDSNIVRSSGINSITDIKLTTTTIGAIILFKLRGLGIQIIGPTGVMPTSRNWQRSMQITYGGTWLTELMCSLSWIFGASWDVRWLITHLMKRHSLGGKRADIKEEDLGRLWACDSSNIWWKMDCRQE